MSDGSAGGRADQPPDAAPPAASAAATGGSGGALPPPGADVEFESSSHVRARRCPRAIAAMWAWQTAVASIVAWPAAFFVSRTFGADPRGDAVLWSPGGHPLLVLLSHDSRAVRASLVLASIVLAAGAIAGLLPTAALMAAMLDRRRARAASAAAYATARAVRALPAIGIVLVLALLAQGAAVATGYTAAKVVDLYARAGLGEAGADRLEALVFFPALPSVVVLSIGHDLARAAAIRFRTGAVRAMWLGARTLRREPWSTLWGWCWREGASLAAVLAGSLAAGALGGRRGAALVAVAAAHQATIAIRVAFRTSWLAKTLRTVAS